MKTFERGAIWQILYTQIFIDKYIIVNTFILVFFTYFLLLQAIEEIDISEKAVAAAVNETIESAGVNVSSFLSNYDSFISII